MTHAAVATAAPAAEVAALESKLALYLGLQDEALQAGDDEDAEALGEAVERVCAKLEALRG